jgi:hypothetical protein
MAGGDFNRKICIFSKQSLSKINSFLTQVDVVWYEPEMVRQEIGNGLVTDFAGLVSCFLTGMKRYSSYTLLFFLYFLDDTGDEITIRACSLGEKQFI